MSRGQRAGLQTRSRGLESGVDHDILRSCSVRDWIFFIELSIPVCLSEVVVFISSSVASILGFLVLSVVGVSFWPRPMYIPGALRTE